MVGAAGPERGAAILGGFAPGEPATRHDATNIQNHYVKNKCFCV